MGRMFSNLYTHTTKSHPYPTHQVVGIVNHPTFTDPTDQRLHPLWGDSDKVPPSLQVGKRHLCTHQHRRLLSTTVLSNQDTRLTHINQACTTQGGLQRAMEDMEETVGEMMTPMTHIAQMPLARDSPVGSDPTVMAGMEVTLVPCTMPTRGVLAHQHHTTHHQMAAEVEMEEVR